MSRAPMPVVKMGRWLVWPGGYSRKMTLRELWRWHTGKPLRVRR